MVLPDPQLVILLPPGRKGPARGARTADRRHPGAGHAPSGPGAHRTAGGGPLFAEPAGFAPVRRA